jgi:hypothetical protein
MCALCCAAVLLHIIVSQVTDSFLLPEMVGRIAAMLNYFLKYLTGPERKGLKVRPTAAHPFLFFWGVFVTREHVRHNKSGIAHRSRARINH